MPTERTLDRSDESALALPPLGVLIVDDERLARLRVEDLLAREPEVEIVGTARDGGAAVEAIRTLRPDLVFLDVQMPVMTGLDVLREVGPDAMPATIFVTAFDQYALQAFDAAAVDYLVKPFGDERFEEAFRRARRRLALEGIERQREQLLAALQRMAPSSARGAPQTSEATPASAAQGAPLPNAVAYAERIAVETHGRVRAVPVAQIDYITASGSYAELHVRDGATIHRHLIRETMQALEGRLDPSRFLRVHRSVIVRLELVDLLHRSPGGDYEVQLKGGMRLPVSRSRSAALERWLGLSP
ncbi:LytTR family DNA-binding domain-containing protein [soil metagenome]